MKNIKEYILETIKVNHTPAFSEKVSFTASAWNDWKASSTSEIITVFEDPSKSNLCEIYQGANKAHIGTYDIKAQELWCNDKSIFNIEEE